VPKLVSREGLETSIGCGKRVNNELSICRTKEYAVGNKGAVRKKNAVGKKSAGGRKKDPPLLSTEIRREK